MTPDERISELERQLAEAKEDTVQLDLVLKNKWRVHRQTPNKWVVIGKNGAEVFGRGSTPREAIDSARKERG